jgi:protein tyrosine phosphatase (PTP) superfamily phosphohydrolase (DUF442 family)
MMAPNVDARSREQSMSDSKDAKDGGPVPPAQRIDRVDDWLYVGGAVPPTDYHRLADVGVARVVDLREQVPDDLGALAALGIERHHAPVVNHTAPTDAQLEQIAAALGPPDADKPVYVHCAGGFGRATTMAVALLVREGVPLAEALARVKQARPETSINEEQMAWLRALETRHRPPR